MLFICITFVLLYNSMVRSHLDYCSSVWAPYKKGDIEALEKVQKKATEIVPALKNVSYSERLKTCLMTTLHYRRIRGNMIETYKIVTGQYEAYVAPSLTRKRTYVTRGNDLRLKSSVLNTTYENTVFLLQGTGSRSEVLYD